MQLRSCDNCGVVLDLFKLRFPKDIWHRDGTVDDSKAKWDGSGYTAFCECPVCSEPIMASE